MICCRVHQLVMANIHSPAKEPTQKHPPKKWTQKGQTMAARPMRKAGHRGIWRDTAVGWSVTMRKMSSVRWSIPRIGFSISGLVCVSPLYNWTATCAVPYV